MQYVDAAGLYFPDGEKHFLREKKGVPFWKDYQRDRLQAAYPYVRDWRLALDVGAHVGLITRQLAGRFSRVVAFEPNPATYECLAVNVANLHNVFAYRLALGAKLGTAGVAAAADNSGDARLTAGGAVQVVTLDGCAKAHGDTLDPFPGFIKIDVQGYELAVLQGGEKVIRKHRPTVMLEDEPPGKLPDRAFPFGAARELLLSWGARQRKRVGDDYVFDFPEKQ